MAGPVLLWALGLAPVECQSRQVKIRRSESQSRLCVLLTSLCHLLTSGRAYKAPLLFLSSVVVRASSASPCFKGGKGKLHDPEIFQIQLSISSLEQKFFPRNCPIGLEIKGKSHSPRITNSKDKGILPLQQHLRCPCPL